MLEKTTVDCLGGLGAGIGHCSYNVTWAQWYLKSTTTQLFAQQPILAIEKKKTSNLLLLSHVRESTCDPPQRTSNAESVSMLWRHHELYNCISPFSKHFPHHYLTHLTQDLYLTPDNSQMAYWTASFFIRFDVSNNIRFWIRKISKHLFSSALRRNRYFYIRP